MTASVGLHLTVAVLLAFRLGVADAPKPIGIEMLYLGEMKKAVPFTQVVKPRPLPAAKAEKGEMPQVKAEPETAPAAEAAPTALGPAGVRDGAIVSALERYKYELRLFLESRKVYPETAKRLRQTGRVMVAFKVNSDGALSDVAIEAPAGSELLNRAALDLVKGAPRFKPLPDQMNEMKVSLPIEYIL